MSPVVVALSLALQQSAVPPPVEQVTANCTAPVYASEHLICSDPELLEQEGRIAGLWRASQETWSPNPWLEQQDLWFRRRALCAFRTDHRACLSGANAERLSVLGASQPRGGTAIRVQCTADGNQVSLSMVRSGSALAAYDQQRLVWVATRARPEWTPYVRWDGGRSFTVRQVDGLRQRCRTVR